MSTGDSDDGVDAAPAPASSGEPDTTSSGTSGGNGDADRADPPADDPPERADSDPPDGSDAGTEAGDDSGGAAFSPPELRDHLEAGSDAAAAIESLIDERTARIDSDLDEDAFFRNDDGTTTVVTRYDLERTVPNEKKSHFHEVDRYWVNKPYAFVVIFHSEKENEEKYYLVEPHLTPLETDLREFLVGKLKTSIKYSDDEIVMQDGEDARERVIETETHNLLERYDLYADGASSDGGGRFESIREAAELLDPIRERLGFDGDTSEAERDEARELRGIAARPEPAVLEEGSRSLTEHQIEKLFYFLKRDFLGFERIDGIKHDINVEDISCDGYDSPVFVYHSEYEQIITNVYHGTEELDEFVVKLAQRSGKGISKRSPQVDATLPDGSRAQLTLGREVSDHGTNYTIRQFKEVPHTPIDLINWNTFSLEQMAFLWLSIENQKSLIFAGGTASGKTTSLNAVSLFIPSKAKIVSIEDTREVELPQRNWIASVTRPSFGDDDKGDVDEFDLLEAALRQRPEYIVMGEIRGEEGRTLFQVMSTGHTTLTTFHADSVGEVIKRFTTDPINVSKTMFTALDLVSVQSQTRIRGNKVRRTKSITEINHYDPENDEINVKDVYQWQAQSDTFLSMGDSSTLDTIAFDRGWSREELDEEIFIHELVLAYLIHEGLNTYTQVAATLQAFINDPETILSLIATGRLERSLEDLREMESVEIDIDPEKEAMVPRPEASDEMLEKTAGILEEAESLLEEYRTGEVAEGVAEALDIEPDDDVEVLGPREEGASGAIDAAGVDFDPGDGNAEYVGDSDDTATTDGGRGTGQTDGAGPDPPAESESASESADRSPPDDRDLDDGDGWAS